MKNKNTNDRQKCRTSFLNKISKELFPENYTCDICGAETFGGNFCTDCLEKITFNDKHICPVCGRKTFRPEICMNCKSKPPLFKKAVSAFVYENGAIVLISKFKNGKPYLKKFFADKIAERLVGFPEIDCIVYVPLTKLSTIRRGYNQSRLLASALSPRICTPVIHDAIKRVKKTKIQKGLSKKQRIENVKGAFKINKRKEIKDKSVLIIDDVMTTGATVNEISRILLNAGAKNVYVATVASVEYLTEEKRLEKKS